MKTSFWRVTLCLFMLLTLVVSTAAAASVAEKKQELRKKTSATLEELYQKQPSAKAVIDKSAGYAVFVNTGFKLGILGSSHGRGIAVNNQTKQEVFMKMNEYQAGLGFGVKEYALIFVFGSEYAWNSFIDNGWDFGGQANAVVSDGVNGDSMEGAISVTSGIWMYQLTGKGLSAELAVKGTRYYKDSDLN